MDTTTAKENEMTLSDGRTIKVETIGTEYAVVMVQTDGRESVKEDGPLTWPARTLGGT
jgi:hypothetical protein